MRTRNNVSFTSTAITSGIVGNNTIEVRMTLGLNKTENQTQFTFHGGKVSNGKFGYFGEFRPMPLQYKMKDGERVLQTNNDGSPKTSNIWVANASEKTIELSAQDQMLLAGAQANPEFAKFLPQNIQDAMNNSSIEYEMFDWGTFLSVVGHTSVKFTFSIPTELYSVVENIKETLISKEIGKNYSLVLRFNADDMQLQQELKNEYNSELYRQDIKIVPTYIGIIDGITAQKEKTGLINPVNIANALQLAKEAKSNKALNPYLSSEFLQIQANKVQERLNAIGTGKKAHQPIVTELFDAAKINNRGDFAQAVATLSAIAERGTNSIVTQSYVEATVVKAEGEFTQANEKELAILFDD